MVRREQYNAVIAPHLIAQHPHLDLPDDGAFTDLHDEDHELNQSALDHQHRRRQPSDDHDPAGQRRATTADDVLADLHQHGYAIVDKPYPDRS